jgi:hypothetical protein
MLVCSISENAVATPIMLAQHHWDGCYVDQMCGPLRRRLVRCTQLKLDDSPVEIYWAIRPNQHHK